MQNLAELRPSLFLLFKFSGSYLMSLGPANPHEGTSRLPPPRLYTGEGSGAGPHHEEGVPDPEAAPAQGALRDGDVLAVHGNGLRGRLTHGTAADVLGDLGLADGHHGNGGGGGEPVGFIVAPSVVAHFVDVAVDEGHGAEAGQAGASKAWKESRCAGAAKVWLRGGAETVPSATRTGPAGLTSNRLSRAGTALLPGLAHCTSTGVRWSNPLCNAPGKFENERNLYKLHNDSLINLLYKTGIY